MRLDVGSLYVRMSRWKTCFVKQRRARAARGAREIYFVRGTEDLMILTY